MSEQPENNTDVVAPEVDVVPKSELQKVLNEVHSWKNKAKKYEETIKAKETDELKKREEWKKLAELKEQEAIDARKEADSIKSTLALEKKYGAIKEAAINAGLRKEALDDLYLLDFDDVQLETTSTGRINVLNTDKAIDRLKTLRPHWFASKKNPVNSDSPEVITGDKVNLDQVLKAEENYKKSRSDKDYETYRELLLKYKNKQ